MNLLKSIPEPANMSLAPKSEWRPTAISSLRCRAQLLAQIRNFFNARGVLEVETPVLNQYRVTDVYIESFSTEYHNNNASQTYYLQTSPEYAMKRLLAAGSGPIYQICKAFRNGEFGRQHNPEFTMLEWYRPGFDHHALMNEMDDLLQLVLNAKPANRKSYSQLFQEYLSLDPLQSDLATLHYYLDKHNIKIENQADGLDYDTCLQLLLGHLIEPHLGFDAPLFLYDFPASQAALAKIRPDNPPVAERFEVYINGSEIANGFHELNNATEQLSRFEADQQKRAELNLPVSAIDHRLITALQHGLPDCAGVALGIDRLLMIKMGVKEIKNVVNFSWELA